MNTSERDAWLKALLPGILTGVIYVFWFARPGFQQLSAASEEAARSRESIPAASVMYARKREVEELTRERDNAAKPKAPTAVFEPKPSHDRPLAIQKITEILSKRGMTLSSSKAADANGKGQSLPADATELSNRLIKEYGIAQPKLWVLEVSGTYTSMTGALKDLSTVDQMIVPVALDMEPSEGDESLLIWSLTVWM